MISKTMFLNSTVYNGYSVNKITIKIVTDAGCHGGTWNMGLVFACKVSFHIQLILVLWNGETVINRNYKNIS